jgi:hypothetical protein
VTAFCWSWTSRQLDLKIVISICEQLNYTVNVSCKECIKRFYTVWCVWGVCTRYIPSEFWICTLANQQYCSRSTIEKVAIHCRHFLGMEALQGGVLSSVFLIYLVKGLLSFTGRKTPKKNSAIFITNKVILKWCH